MRPGLRARPFFHVRITEQLGGAQPLDAGRRTPTSSRQNASEPRRSWVARSWPSRVKRTPPGASRGTSCRRQTRVELEEVDVEHHHVERRRHQVGQGLGEPPLWKLTTLGGAQPAHRALHLGQGGAEGPGAELDRPAVHVPVPLTVGRQSAEGVAHDEPPSGRAHRQAELGGARAVAAAGLEHDRPLARQDGAAHRQHLAERVVAAHLVGDGGEAAHQVDPRRQRRPHRSVAQEADEVAPVARGQVLERHPAPVQAAGTAPHY